MTSNMWGSKKGLEIIAALRPSAILKENGKFNVLVVDFGWHAYASLPIHFVHFSNILQEFNTINTYSDSLGDSKSRKWTKLICTTFAKDFATLKEREGEC